MDATFTVNHFEGHAIPGTYFLTIGIWWTVNISIRYFSCLKKGTKFTSNAAFTCPALFGRSKKWPIEGIWKVCVSTFGIIVEIQTGCRGTQLVFLTNAQHSTMYFVFGLSGVFDILVHLKMSVLPDLDYLTVAVALAVESLLFVFHLQGRTELDVLVHTLLIYAVVANTAAFLLEMTHRNSVLLALVRAMTSCVHGTWFWQIGFILYPLGNNTERWNEEDHDQKMLAVMMFTWHMIADLLLVLIIVAIVSCFQKRERGEDIALTSLLNTESDILNDDCSESSELEIHNSYSAV